LSTCAIVNFVVNLLYRILQEAVAHLAASSELTLI
jgi:hypothetical protein